MQAFGIGKRVSLGTLALAVALSFAASLATASLAIAEEAKAQGAYNWSSYYDRTGQRPPRAVLIEALRAFEQEGRKVKLAVDAGCGTGVETLFLSNLGVEVVAFDSEAEGIARLRRSLDEKQAELVRLQVAPFHEADWGEGVDLVFAGFALPFADPSEFPEAWRRLTDSLAPGGRFAGQLFGDRDGWAGGDDMTHHRRSQAEALVAEDFDIEVFREVEHDRKTASGAMKHWHYFEIIARKR